MKRVHHWLSASVVLLLSAGMLVSGCGEGDRGALVPLVDPTQPDYDPNDPFGGFTMTDEEPAFGDPELLADAALEVDAEDHVRHHPDIGDMDRDSGASIYALAILWGNLPGQGMPCGDRGQPDGTDYDWSGSVTVTSGAVVLKNTISFEPRLGDRVVLPRTDRRVLEWASHTGCGFDGLRLLVYQRGGGGEGNGILRFETPLYTREIAIADLADLDEVIDVDEDGNQVRFLGSVFRPHDQVGRGFLRGRWGAIDPDVSRGHFQGVWVCPRGRIEGYMRGYYGYNDAGRRVFFGKYIDENGGFRGILRGTWNPVVHEERPQGGHVGVFSGNWVSESNRHAGELAGRWQLRDGGPGRYDGRWWTTEAPTPPPKD